MARPGNIIGTEKYTTGEIITWDDQGRYFVNGVERGQQEINWIRANRTQVPKTEQELIAEQKFIEGQNLVEEQRNKLEETARRNAFESSGQTPNDPYATGGGPAIDWWTGKSAKSVQESQEAASRRRIESGDPLAELGAGKQTADEIRSNRWRQPDYIQELFGKGFYAGYGDKGLQGGLGEMPGFTGEPDPSFPRGGMAGATYEPSTEVEIPEIYSTKVNLDLGLSDAPVLDTSKFSTAKFETAPEATPVEDLLTQEGNAQTFDTLKRTGSFEIQTASPRPFGGADPTTAFLQTDITPLSDVSKNKKGNTIFRWA